MEVWYLSQYSLLQRKTNNKYVGFFTKRLKEANAQRNILKEYFIKIPAVKQGNNFAPLREIFLETKTYYCFLNSPPFHACINSFHAKGLNIFIGGIWPE